MSFPLPFNQESSIPKDMKSCFPDLPTNFPPYHLCQFQKRNTVDTGIDNRKEAIVRGGQTITRGENLGYEISPSFTWRFPQAPPKSFSEFTLDEIRQQDFVNLDGRGDVFYGYARNIDVESELKQINRLDDKCFDNNYKINPNSQDNALFKHRDIIVKDYIKAQENTYRQKNINPLHCLDPYNYNSQPSQSQVSPIEDSNQLFFEIGEGFNKPKECYSRTKEIPFNNMTKRRILYTRNKYEKNPDKYF